MGQTVSFLHKDQQVVSFRGLHALKVGARVGLRVAQADLPRAVLRLEPFRDAARGRRPKVNRELRQSGRSERCIEAALRSGTDGEVSHPVRLHVGGPKCPLIENQAAHQRARSEDVAQVRPYWAVVRGNHHFRSRRRLVQDPFRVLSHTAQVGVVKIRRPAHDVSVLPGQRPFGFR